MDCMMMHNMSYIKKNPTVTFYTLVFLKINLKVTKNEKIWLKIWLK